MPIASNSPTPLDRLNAIASADDDAPLAIRELLISDDDHDRADASIEYTIARADIDAICDLIDDLDRDALSLLLLDYSLCPMHRCDYAICFDDAEPECAAIRECFPSHDT
jgi:hypothetical protein